MVIGSLAVATALSGSIGAILWAVTVGYAALMYPLAYPIQDRQGRALQAYTNVESSYIDSLKGIATIAAFGAESGFTRRTVSMFDAFQRRLRDVAIRQAELTGAAELLSGLIVTGALVLAARQVILGRLELGTMLAIYSLAAMAMPSVTRLLDSSVLVQGAAVASNRLLDLLLAAPEPRGEGSAFSLRVSLEMNAVTYSWGANAPVILREATLTIPKGELTALCGPSGSGKTTVVGLLSRRYSVTTGDIRVDGRPVDRIELTAYRRAVAVVQDDAMIFSDSLGANILLDRASSEHQHMLGALIDRLGLGPFLGRFPQGLNTPVGERGRRLSSGERQVTAILRGLVGQPDLLIVDEGLNGMDPDLRSPVLAMLRDYARQHAVLLVTHDRELLSHADRVYGMDGGSVTLVRATPPSASHPARQNTGNAAGVATSIEPRVAS